MISQARTSIMRRTLMCALLSVCSCAAVAQSAETASDGLRLSGFGTLGAVHASAPEGWGFVRDVSQPNNDGGTRYDIDTRLGLQVNYAPSAQFELVGQLLLTRRLPTVSASDAVEWAFAAYRPNAEVTLRLGRVNVDQFLMSDYHNVGFAYLYARPPVEFYSVLPTSLDGFDIARSWSAAGAQWKTKFFAGGIHSSDVKIKPLFGAMLSREADGLTLRGGLTHTKVANSEARLQPLLDGLSGLGMLPISSVANEADALRSQLDLAGAHVTYAALGVSYELNDWQWAAEAMRSTGHRAVDFQAGYMGVGRRFGALTVYGLASAIGTHAPPVNSPDWGATLAPVIGLEGAQQAQVLGSTAAYAANVLAARQNTLSLGTRWDVGPRMALKLQVDHVRIGANGSLLWSNAAPIAGQANVGSVVLDFIY